MLGERPLTANPPTLPFANYAFDVENKDDADSDPSNEFQTLSLDGDTLMLSDGNQVVLPYDSSNWKMNGSAMYYNAGKVGIGSSTPVSNLEVKANTIGTDALFQVINADNDTVFAVYPDGVKVFPSRIASKIALMVSPRKTEMIEGGASLAPNR